MTAPPSPARRLAAEIARDTVAAVAPDELVFFEAARTEFFTDPDEVLDGRRLRDEVLGYGAGEIVQLVTPAALAVSAAIVGAVADRAGAVVVDRTIRAGRRLLRRLSARRGRREPAASAEPAPDEQARRPEVTLDDLDDLRSRVAEEARRRALPENLIEPFTDAFVASVIEHWAGSGRPGRAGTGTRAAAGTGAGTGVAAAGTAAATGTGAGAAGTAAGTGAEAGGAAEAPPADGESASREAG